VALRNIPRQDGLAAAWMTTFTERLAEDPAGFRVAPAEVADAAAKVRAFVEALSAASDNPNRSQLLVYTKNACRAEAEASCRALYMAVRVDPLVPDPRKVYAGVRPVKAQRSRVTAPTTRPVLRSKLAPSGMHILCFSDAESMESSRRPEGATALQLFAAVSDSISECGEMEFVGCYSRGPIRLTLRPSDHGKFIHYAARWMTRRGEAGPMGPTLAVYAVVLTSAGTATLRAA
jgi:hypothetical protein